MICSNIHKIFVFLYDKHNSFKQYAPRNIGNDTKENSVGYIFISVRFHINRADVYIIIYIC